MSEPNRDEVRRQVEVLGKKEKKPGSTDNLSAPYFSFNKLHAFFDGEAASFKAAREEFCKDLEKYKKNEEATVEQLKASGGKIRLWTNAEQTEFVEITPDTGLLAEKYPLVLSLLDACTDIYQIEALARTFFDDGKVPTLDEVRARGRSIKSAFDFYGAHKALRAESSKRIKV